MVKRRLVGVSVRIIKFKKSLCLYFKLLYGEVGKRQTILKSPLEELMKLARNQGVNVIRKRPMPSTGLYLWRFTNSFSTYLR